MENSLRSYPSRAKWKLLKGSSWKSAWQWGLRIYGLLQPEH